MMLYFASEALLYKFPQPARAENKRVYLQFIRKKPNGKGLAANSLKAPVVINASIFL